jgi:predicted glycoside hydrolase/deacetylase ChbG (UPF0249 family)
MLIINADDLGRDQRATANSIACYREGLITSASAMVFMADSRRAADLALDAGLETGLHLNLSLPFDGPEVPLTLRDNQFALGNCFRSSKWSQVLYHPLLRKKLEYVFKAQYDEYCRLFKSEPVKIDGHHHLHLCMNMIVDHPIPPGCRVRRNFSFEADEKDLINRTYRRLVDAWLVRRYCCTDSFYSIKPINARRLEKIMSQAGSTNVEMMVHPDKADEYAFLGSLEYRALIEGVPQGTYRMLCGS